MASDRQSPTNLADPSAALVSYLDDLLHTATTIATETVVEPDAEPESPEPPVQALTDEAIAPDLPVEAPEPEFSPDQPPVEVVQEAPTPQPPAPLEPEGNPEWAGRPFECLIFKVAGLQLAVPLVLLGAIHRMDDRVKPIPGRPPWYMGMLLDRDQKLKVVDSAEWIMAGRVPDAAREGYRFVIRLDDSDWALACDEVAESFTLTPDQVRWRTSRSKRPWLAGTVVKHMCALIDVGAMARLLARAEREHHLELD